MGDQRKVLNKKLAFVFGILFWGWFLYLLLLPYAKPRLEMLACSDYLELSAISSRETWSKLSRRHGVTILVLHVWRMLYLSGWCDALFCPHVPNKTWPKYCWSVHNIACSKRTSRYFHATSERENDRRFDSPLWFPDVIYKKAMRRIKKIAWQSLNAFAGNICCAESEAVSP